MEHECLASFCHKKLMTRAWMKKIKTTTVLIIQTGNCNMLMKENLIF